MTTNLRLFRDANDVSVVTALVNRAVLALTGSSLGVISVILLVGHTGPGSSPGRHLQQMFGYVGLFISITLMLRVVVEVLRRH